MRKDFIPYEEALALKELGFNEETMGSFVNELFQLDGTVIETSFYKVVKAPLYQQAFRWFREKYGFVFYIHTCNHFGELDFHPVIYMKDSDEPIIDTLLDEWDTYEQAELACLNKLIEVVKTK